MHTNRQVYIIAEAGVNHNGSLECAREMVQIAASTGVNAIKFQTFRAEMVVTETAPKAHYQKKATGAEETQLGMLKKLELNFDEHKKLIECCRQHNIDFLSTPFDLESVYLLSNLGLTTWKIPSGEITNLPLLRQIGSFGQDVILSTGMADLGEIEDGLDVLQNAGTPRDKITILHCNTQYPTPISDTNLKALQTIQFAFPGVKYGYSDHTLGIEIPIAAVALGATIIEKHFTQDKNLPGPDHKASLEPDELTSMVRAIRNVEQAMGSGIKKPSPSEIKNIIIVRKSIVARRNISIGEYFTEENLTVKRPGNGLSPMKWDETIGRKARRDYSEDELIDP